MGEYKSITTYRGRRITELGRDELIEAIDEAARIIKDMHEQYRRDLEFLGSVYETHIKHE